ncbi:MAG: TAXI family TRAP transporter solute-binding subunit [Pseudomonadales bacterium]|nr:TAXI family TRAP transporter solute-binding subunit [Pseudomonadales bacterium]
MVNLGFLSRFRSVWAVFISVGVTALVFSPYSLATDQADNKSSRAHILATATTAGTFYPVGVALATLTKLRLMPGTGISLSAISSAGSAENIKMLRKNEVQFAILQGLYAAWAWSGEGPFEKQGAQTELRAVTMLWQNVEHFVVDEAVVGSGSLADLANLKLEKFSMGKRNSGTAGSGFHILESLGIVKGKHYRAVYMGYGASAQALQNGVIKGMNIPAGPPVGAVTRVFAARGRQLKILEVSDDQLARINQRYPLWSRYTIPASTYPYQSKPVNTASQPTLLVVRADVDEQSVYEITRVIYENLGFLGSIHKATKAISLKHSVDGLPLPLHPGALKFYREAGRVIPEQLIPPTAL